MAAAGKTRGRHLAETRLAADMADFPALLRASAQHQFVACRRIMPGAGGVKLCFPVAPARKSSTFADNPECVMLKVSSSKRLMPLRVLQFRHFRGTITSP